MSGTTDPGDKSAAQIEREVEGTRARLAHTLEELRDRVSPGQLMDQAMDYVRGSGGTEFTQNLGRAVRDNPLPVLLIGAGVGWLLLSGGRSSQPPGAQPRRALPAPDASLGTATAHGHGAAAALVPQDTSYNVRHGQGGAGGPSLTERAGAAAGGIGERVGDAAGQAYQGVAGAAGSVAEGVGAAAGTALQRASEAAQRASELGQDLRHQAARAGEQAQHGLGWLLREQPLVLGAVGVALGAAAGALLPGTEAEDRLMGEASDSLTQRAEAAAREGYERVQEVAGEHLDRAKDAASQAYGAAKDRADQAGLSPANLAGAVGTAAHELRQAVREGAQTAAGQAREAIHQADPANKETDT